MLKLLNSKDYLLNVKGNCGGNCFRFESENQFLHYIFRLSYSVVLSVGLKKRGGTTLSLILDLPRSLCFFPSFLII